MSDSRRRLTQVLAEERFPASRWELIVAAQLYGADVVSVNELHALPEVRFRSLADVLLTVEQTRRAGSRH